MFFMWLDLDVNSQPSGFHRLAHKSPPQYQMIHKLGSKRTITATNLQYYITNMAS